VPEDDPDDDEVSSGSHDHHRSEDGDVDELVVPDKDEGGI